MKNYTLIALIALFSVASCGNASKNKVEAEESQAAASGEGIKLKIDTQASSIEWIGSKPGGSHNGTIGIKNGNLTIDGENVTAGLFTIDMNAIACTDITDTNANQKLVEHLKNADFFDTVKYPESTFTITGIEKAAKADSVTHIVSGNLKMKDIEKNISFGATITKEEGKYKAVTVPFAIDRTQWNVQYGSKSIFADLKDKFINDNIELKITIVATE